MHLRSRDDRPVERSARQRNGNLLTAISLFDTPYLRTKGIKRGKQSLLLSNTLYRVTGYSDISFLESFYSAVEFIRPSQNFINAVYTISFLSDINFYRSDSCILFYKL